MRKRGFTLAEVLITLSIIGVVAALTIPSIVNNAAETQNLIALKKQYNVISQAIMNLQNDPNFQGYITVTHWTNFGNEVKPYLKYVKDSGFSPINYKYYKNLCLLVEKMDIHVWQGRTDGQQAPAQLLR